MLRPSSLWKGMASDKRVVAADAFWRDRESPDIQMQQTEALVTIARRMNFRPKSVQGLSIERRAKHLAQLSDVSDAIATRALIAYHFTTKRELMGAFLDALGIAHDKGLITDENVTAPSQDALKAATATVKQSFDADDVDLYLRTLAALDGDTWAGLQGLVA